MGKGPEVENTTTSIEIVSTIKIKFKKITAKRK